MFSPKRPGDATRASFNADGSVQPPPDAARPRRLLFGPDESAAAQPVAASAKVLLTRQLEGRPRMINFSFAQTRTRPTAEENGADQCDDAPVRDDSRATPSPGRFRRQPRSTFGEDDPDGSRGD
jgi:hypothetical protein